MGKKSTCCKNESLNRSRQHSVSMSIAAGHNIEKIDIVNEALINRQQRNIVESQTKVRKEIRRFFMQCVVKRLRMATLLRMQLVELASISSPTWAIGGFLMRLGIHTMWMSVGYWSDGLVSKVLEQGAQGIYQLIAEGILWWTMIIV